MGQIGRKRLAEGTKSDLKGHKLGTEWDRQNIAFLISFYEKAYPGVIAAVAKDARKDIKTDRKISALKTKGDTQLNMSRRMAIPNGLLQELKKAYPAILADKQQFEQFLRWFPVFDLENV